MEMKHEGASPPADTATSMTFRCMSVRVQD